MRSPIIILLPKTYIKFFALVILVALALVVLSYENHLVIRVFSSAFVKPLQNKVIVIDPGHGGVDGGACRKDCVEKEINLKVAKKLYERLTALGAKVILTRDKDSDLSHLPVITRQRKDLYSRIGIIEKTKPDAFISVHINISRPSMTGAMVFYNRRLPGSKILANALQADLNQLMSKNSFKSHNAKAANYFLLRNSTYPGAIVELGFMSNNSERARLQNDDYQNQLADSLVKGLKNYFSFKSTPVGDINNKISEEQKTKNSLLEHNAIKLFYPIDNSDELGYEVINSKSVANNKLNTTLFETLTALLKGPTKPSLQAIINPKTQLLDVRLEHGVAIVNFSKHIRDFQVSSLTESQIVSSLVETATQFEDVRALKIFVEGQQLDTLNGHIDISNVLTPNKPKNSVAFVIDDLAGGEEGRKEIMSIPRPLTLAVLPQREFSSQIAEEAYQKGYDVFLHVPLEPEHGQPHWLGEGAITSRTPLNEIRVTLLKDLETVPHAIGMNNHMGSKVTKQEKIMREILKIAKEKYLIVLDSRTTQDTVIPKLAAELNLQYLERHVFLDDSTSLSHVKKQIKKLAALALENGTAIAIGHVGVGHKTTAQGIADMIPWLEEQGIEIVFVSDFLK